MTNTTNILALEGYKHSLFCNHHVSSSYGYFLPAYSFWEMQAAQKWGETLQMHMQHVPPHAVLLRPLLAFLIATLQPARVYVTNHNDAAADPHFTVSVVLPSSAAALETFRPILDIAYLQHRNIYCALYNEGALLADLNHHEIYALIHCSQANLVYNDSHLNYPVPEPELLLLAKQKAQNLFATHFAKAQAFLRLAVMDSPAKTNELTSFLLHQATELSSRAVLLSLGGYNVKEHALQVLFKHLRRHAPCLSALFNHEKDKPLLETLEKCYTASRYEANFRVKPEMMPALIDKVSQFLHTAETCVRKKTA